MKIESSTKADIEFGADKTKLFDDGYLRSTYEMLKMFNITASTATASS